MKEPFVFESVALITGKNEVGVWTDGIGVFSDCEEFSAYNLEAGKKYRVTVEEI